MFATVKHIVFPNHLLTVLISPPIFFGFQVHGHYLTAVLSVVLSASLTLKSLALGLFPWGTEEWGMTGTWIKPLLRSRREDHWHCPMKATSIKETSQMKKRSIFIFQVLFHGSLWQLRNRKRFPGSCTKVKWCATHLLPWGWSCVMISWVSREVTAEGWGRCH